MLDVRKGFKADDPMRALGIAAPGQRLDDTARAALASRLLEGEAATEIIADLVKKRVPLELATREVRAAEAHPYLKGAQLMRARLQKRDWLLDCRARLERARLTEVPRRHALAPEIFFADHYASLTPVVLTGLADHWPANGWTLEKLAAKVGNPEVEVQGERTQDPDFELNSIAHKRRMRWKDLLAKLAEDPDTNDFYVTANNGSVNRKALAPLWRDIGDLPGYLGPSRLGDGFFWMGPRGTITPWHHDLTQNLLMTMAGTKRVTLASPLETARMQNHIHCFSRFGQSVDFSALPDAQRPQTLTVDIGPGDILFLPVGWWHHVEGLSLTIGMSFTNFVWDNDFTSFYTTEGALMGAG